MSIKKLFPNASKEFERLNHDSIASGADIKSGIRNGTLAEKKTKTGDTRKYAVRITSYRTRLADVDALCGKWHLDSLRYAGLIHEDTEEAITYQISQKKVENKTQEKTLIEIELLYE